ncbi:MAG: hypothetical protein N2258_03125 [Brevinematales bacterium]|nr:hypothetical protein [Brevinematales bacterium]
MKIFYSLILLLAMSTSYGLKSATYKIVEIIHSIDENKINALTNTLILSLEKYKLNYIALEENFNPDYLISLTITYLDYEETYIINTIIRSVSEKDFILEDSIYTKDIWGNAGFEEAGKNLAKRIITLINGKKTMPYKEITDYRKYYTRKIAQNNYVNDYEMIDFINVGIFYNQGFDYGNGIGFTVKLLEYSKIWLIPETFFGIGVGLGIFDIHSSNAGGILPITLYLPLYIFPDSYEYNRKNLFLTAEWCGLLPSYSYYDVNLRFYFSGIGLKIGWVYYPYYKDNYLERKEESKFYGGIFLFIGNYDIKLSEKKMTNTNQTLSK